MKVTVDDERLAQVLGLAESCNYDAGHTHQVTKLALQIFDCLESLHGLGEDERFWLQCGALLHDIGWCEGQKGHHKTSLRIILDSRGLPFDKREARMVGSIARYHRKAHPKKKHKHYGALKKSDRKIVEILAAILRVADGLDRTHRDVVRNIQCTITRKKIVLKCKVNYAAEPERDAAMKKGGLFEEVFGRQLELEIE
jgi:exopolyphosphatase/guanosine-5'-triphosphate,3'-diphosphate pyrophosphatase